ncbi:ribokinase [Lentibacillus kapialis]|uniref:Ribokinase n=1 Tax=Lentibacillus kapialis TaxID=340214 RepID=A0A917V045_9BACI|nr:ribokinase [Lentibacillus kapialis]GGK02367.1 ribokinase [Lentibacillus kapialis]
MREELDLIVYGSLNMDYVGYVEKLPSVGETVASKNFSIGPGGKAANQAVAASKLNANVAMVGRIGKDQIGEEMKAELRKEGVDDENIYYTSDSKTGIAMISVNPKGENMIVTHVGANALLSKKDIDSAEKKLRQAQGAVLQLEMEKDVAEHIIQKVSNQGKKVILNLAPIVSLEKYVLGLVDLLIVNESEATYLAGIEVESIESAKEAVTIIRNLGIDNVVITLGSMGAVLENESTTEFYAAPIVDVVDSTAAGDCFVAAVSLFWIRTGDLAHSVKNAVNVATLSVTKRGAQVSLPTLEEYEKFLKEKISN